MVAKKIQKRNNQGFGQDEKEKSVSKDVKQTSRPVTPEERGKAIFNHIEAAVDAEIANQELQEALFRKTLEDVMGGNSAEIKALPNLAEKDFRTVLPTEISQKVLRKNSTPKFNLQLLSQIESENPVTQERRSE